MGSIWLGFFSQSLYVAQLEPELLLQPDRRHLPGKVETGNPSDVWEYLEVAQIHQAPDYISKLSGPMRLVYPDGMAERELITSLAKVQINHEFVLSVKSQTVFVYRESTTMPLKRTLQL